MIMPKRKSLAATADLAMLIFEDMVCSTHGDLIAAQEQAWGMHSNDL